MAKFLPYQFSFARTEITVALFLILFLIALYLSLNSLFGSNDNVIVFKYLPIALALIIIYALLFLPLLQWNSQNILKVFGPILLVGIILNVVLNGMIVSSCEGKGMTAHTLAADNSGDAVKYKLRDHIKNNLWLHYSKS